MIRLRAIINRVVSFARPGNWWFSKIPPLLAVAYLAILLQGIDLGRASLLIASFVASVSCVAIYGHLINDAFDIDDDRRAGKPNAMATLGPNGRWVLTLSFLCAGFVPAALVGYSGCSILLLALNYLWPTIYSVPKMRLKERGVLGILCDALGSHITPTLLALSVFVATASDAPLDQFGFPLMISVWAAILGIKGILHHQIMDRDNDLRSGTVTLATTAPSEAIMRFLTWFNLSIEIPVSVALATIVFRWCPFVAAALAAYFVLETIKYVLGFRFSLTANSRSDRPSVPFANELFYVFWLPLAAAVQLAVREREWIWLPVVHAALFYQPLLLQMLDVKKIIQVATRPYRRRLFGPRK